MPAAPGMFSTGAVRTMPGLLHDLLHHARGLVPAAAGGGGRDDPQVLVGGLRLNRGNAGQNQRRQRMAEARTPRIL